MTEAETTVLPTSDCTVCSHPDAAAIDAGLLGGTPIRSVAETHGLSRSSVHRHRQNHLTLQAITDESTEKATDGQPRALRIVDVHGQLADLVDRLEKVVELASRTRKAPAAVAAMRELRMTLVAIADVQATRDLQRAASKQRLEEWCDEQASRAMVRMLDFVIAQFGLPQRTGAWGSDERSGIVDGLMADSLRLIGKHGADANFNQVDSTRAQAFVEAQARDRAERIEAEVQRRVEVELRRREAQARPALQAREVRELEGGSTWAV